MRLCAQIFAFAHDGLSPLPSAGGAYLSAGGTPKVATDTDNLRLTIIFSKCDGFVT